MPAPARRVVVPFATATNVFPAGALVPADDPVVTKHARYFAPEVVEDPRRSAPVVEQATAAPGEVRDVPVKKKAAAKKAPAKKKG